MIRDGEGDVLPWNASKCLLLCPAYATSEGCSQQLRLGLSLDAHGKFPVTIKSSVR